MTVKVMLLKSGEDVISDAKEIMDTENKGIVAYHLSNPFLMQLTAFKNHQKFFLLCSHGEFLIPF